jgi:hypothetical protein
VAVLAQCQLIQFNFTPKRDGRIDALSMCLI